MMPTKKEVMDALRGVKDPEIGVNVVDMGLIYEVKVSGSSVKIKMTFTSMFCPLAGVMEADVRGTLGKLKGVKKVDVDIVFDPPWSPERMSDEARLEIGL
jgi:metal-sulfur cluster biosynthetic enzyme